MQTLEEVINKYAKSIKEIIARAAHDVRTIQAQQMSDAFTKIAYGFGSSPAAVKPVVQRLQQSFKDAVSPQRAAPKSAPPRKPPAKKPAVSQKARILAQLTLIAKSPGQIAAAAKAPLQSVYSVLSEARAKKQARCPQPGLYVKV